MLAMVVNDIAGSLTPRRDLRFSRDARSCKGACGSALYEQNGIWKWI